MKCVGSEFTGNVTTHSLHQDQERENVRDSESAMPAAFHISDSTLNQWLCSEPACHASFATSMELDDHNLLGTHDTANITTMDYVF